MYTNATFGLVDTGQESVEGEPKLSVFNIVSYAGMFGYFMTKLSTNSLHKFYSHKIHKHAYVVRRL